VIISLVERGEAVANKLLKMPLTDRKRFRIRDAPVMAIYHQDVALRTADLLEDCSPFAVHWSAG